MLTESVSLLPGFSSYFSFSRRRTGYSGVATFCRNNSTPTQAEEGLAGSFENPVGTVDEDPGGGSSLKNLCEEFSLESRRALDNEGRCVITRHKLEGGRYLSIFNLYCPRADPEREDRKTFKLQFYRAVDLRAAALRERGDSVIVLGDINTSHREEDHCEPYLGFRDRADRRFLDHFIFTSRTAFCSRKKVPPSKCLNSQLPISRELPPLTKDHPNGSPLVNGNQSKFDFAQVHCLRSRRFQGFQYRLRY